MPQPSYAAAGAGVTMRAAFALALLVSLAPVTLAAPTGHAAYFGQPVGVGCYGIVTPGDCPEVENAGVQFGPFDAARVDIAIHDATGLRVGAAYTFYDADGVEKDYGTLCGKARDVAVPEGAEYLVVTVDMAFTAKHCPRGASGTSGDVVVRFT